MCAEKQNKNLTDCNSEALSVGVINNCGRKLQPTHTPPKKRTKISSRIALRQTKWDLKKLFCVQMGSAFRHKHLYTFHKFWDINKDGVLTWDDFRLLAEKYTKIQRRGKLDQDVFERWQSILGKWWDELTEHADFNKDTIVEFDEWLKFFTNLGKSTKSHKELPDFLQTYLHLFFLIMDTNKDGLFCVKDYKKYLTAHNMDVSRAVECFTGMLNDEDRSNGNAMTSDRFRELVYDFWVSHDPGSPGRYICGTFDSALLDELEGMTKKKT